MFDDNRDYTSFIISFTGDEQEDVKYMTDEFFDALDFEEETDVERVSDSEIEVIESFDYSRLNDIIHFVLDNIDEGVDVKCYMEGSVISDYFGEALDFCITYENSRMKLETSNWYANISVDEYDSYEEFTKDYANIFSADNKMTKEDFMLAKEIRANYYIMRDPKHTIVKDNIPMCSVVDYELATMDTVF